MSDQPAFPLVIEKDSVWCWEPLNPAERCEVTVLSAAWAGDRWYIEIQALEDSGHMWTGMRHSCDLNWFTEAAVLVSEPRGSSHDARHGETMIDVTYSQD